ncbi:MAG: ATP-grasp domain-containing protein [Acidobacteria bacterium]|nr:MAG: ATP-grasp domain-containing protein [Acidobacteriota bacterium]
MNVLMISPGFPAEMPYFTRGLAEVGARVLGVGDQPPPLVPEIARRALSDYLQVRNLWDEEAVIAELKRWSKRQRIDRIECLWEPGMLLAARLREALGLPGMTVEETLPLRDKERMKQVLDRAGIRTPRHARATTAGQVRAAAERIGYPLIVKPIAGAGSADTYRVDDAAHLERVLPRLRHVPEVSVEEFIDGEEYTFDTICAGGEVFYYNVSWYRPRPLIARSEEWISPQTVALRRVDQPELAGGRAMGLAVLKALGFRTGFSHMEWFRKPDGEAVFGEIGGRPPGARSVDIMNYACDLDVYRGWAEAVVHRRFSQPIERKYNAAVIFKRAQGQGRIRRIAGLGKLLADFGPHVVCVDLAPVGAPRRDWRQTLISDGYLIVRHPELRATLEMADRVGTDLQLFAG